MAITVVQAAEATTVSNGAATPTFGSNVTAGNLLVAMSFGTTANMQAFPTTGQNSWSRVTGFQDSGTFDFTIEIWTRTALAGDHLTPPTINSNYNSDRNYVVMWEISGGGGSVVVDTTDTGEVSGAGGTSSSLTTGANNTLVLGACAAKFAFSVISGGGWSNDGNSPYMVHQAVVSSGGTTNLTIASSGGGGDTTFGMISLKAGGNTETANPVSLALAGVSFNVGGLKYREGGPVALVLAGVTMKVNGVDVSAEPVLVNFSTF